MNVTASEIAQLVNGQIEGNPTAIVTHPARIEEGKKGSICFLADSKYEAFAYQTEASVLLVAEDFVPKQKIKATLVRVADVRQAITTLLAAFGQKTNTSTGISEKASISSTANVDDTASIGAFTVIEAEANIGANAVLYPQVYVGVGATIGDNVTLMPGVKIGANCEVRDNCIIHHNTVIGSDGFGFLPEEDGRYRKIMHHGNVIIEQEVEIGANTVVDRAVMGSTIIKAGSKLDNLIQIAHNVEIGEHTVIAAQAGIAGSTKIGRNVMIGGQAGFVGHIEVADRVRVQAQSGIAASIKDEGAAVYGSPALSYRDYLRAYAVFKRLPDLKKSVDELINEQEKHEK